MYAVAASVSPAATAARLDPPSARCSASANSGMVKAATRSKWPSMCTPTYGDRPNVTAANADGATRLVNVQASAYIDAWFANTYTTSKRFCVATGDARPSRVAPTNAGSAVLG